MLSLAIRKPIWDLNPCIPYWPLKYVNKFFKNCKIRYIFGFFHHENAAFITKQEQSLFARHKRCLIILEDNNSTLNYCQKHKSLYMYKIFFFFFLLDVYSGRDKRYHLWKKNFTFSMPVNDWDQSAQLEGGVSRAFLRSEIST